MWKPTSIIKHRHLLQPREMKTRYSATKHVRQFDNLKKRGTKQIEVTFHHVWWVSPTKIRSSRKKNNTCEHFFAWAKILLQPLDAFSAQPREAARKAAHTFLYVLPTHVPTLMRSLLHVFPPSHVGRSGANRSWKLLYRCRFMDGKVIYEDSSLLCFMLRTTVVEID